MAYIYFRLIQLGAKTIDDVPVSLRFDVQKLIDQAEGA